MTKSIYSDFAPYNLMLQEYPKEIKARTLHFLNSTHNILKQKKRHTITILYACHPSQWHRDPTRIQMLTFGTYRKFFPVVELLSEILAPLYLEFEILPDIFPLFPDRMKEYDRIILPTIRKSGILIFSQEL